MAPTMQAQVATTQSQMYDAYYPCNRLVNNAPVILYSA